MKQSLFTILVFLITGSFIEAKGVFKRYPVKSGMIFYDIHTAGKKTIPLVDMPLHWYTKFLLRVIKIKRY